MAEFHQAVLTQKGIDLLAKAQADSTQIRFTRAVSGSGEYEDGEDFSQQESLRDERQSFAITSIKRQNRSNVFLQFSITNLVGEEKLEQGYRVTEVGIIADDPDDGEILYAIAVAKTGKSDYLESYNDLLPAVIRVEFLIEVGNAENVQLVTDLAAYATKEDLQTKGDAIRFDDTNDLLTLYSEGMAISSTPIPFASALDAIISPLKTQWKALFDNLDERVTEIERYLFRYRNAYYDVETSSVVVSEGATYEEDESEPVEGARYDRTTQTITILADGASYDDGTITISDTIASYEDGTIVLKFAPDESLTSGGTIVLDSDIARYENGSIILADEVPSGGGSPWKLPIASADTLGGVKIGEGVQITDDGTISFVDETIDGARMATETDTSDALDDIGKILDGVTS